MKVIIAGSRTLGRYSLENALKECPWNSEITEVVTGCAHGIDECGEYWAREKNLPVTRFPANWRQFGRAAGIRRNMQMATYADALIAVWDGETPGTRNMIDIATRAGLLVFVWRPNGTDKT